MDHLRAQVRPALLRWAVAVFCALVGALMLIAPHQFAGATFEPLRPWLTEWGAAFFLAGVALVTTSALGIRGIPAALASTAAALVLLLLALSFLVTGGWTGVAAFGLFGLAVLVSPVFDPSGHTDRFSLDLFVVTASLVAIANGLILLLPVLAAGSMFDPARTGLSTYSLLFLAGGVSVLLARVWPRPMPLFRVLTQTLLGAAYLAWFVGSALPLRVWTGIILYAGVGGLLVSGPWLARWTPRIDASSLRVRLALLMASSAAFPLLFVATVATGLEEQAAAERQLELQQAIAGGLAADVGGALTQHLVGLVLVAEHPAVLARATASTEGGRGSIGNVAPGLITLGIFDGAGRPTVVLAGRDPEAPTRLSQLAGTALRRLQADQAPPTAFLAADDDTIVLAAPVRLPSGAVTGIGVGELDRQWLQARLQRGVADANLSALLFDGNSRLVATAGDPLDGVTDPSLHPSLESLRASPMLRGSLRFKMGSNETLSGYARVPDTDWIVVVQQPASSALASVWVSRELTFLVLLAAFVVASAVGVMVANRLATPLAVLARAAHLLATGATTTNLPSSRIYEVRVVARAFAQMQARLAARTVERERADTRLRILAQASGELTRSLDEDAIISALGQITVGHLADWCAVDIVRATPQQEPQIARVMTLHRDAREQAEAARMSASFDSTAPLLLPPDGHPAITGKPVLLAEVTPRQLADMTASPEDLQAINWLGMRSLIMVPLRARDQVLGTLTCVYGRGAHRYDADDLSLAREIASRAALAIDNARLFAAEHAARGEAEAAVRMREEFLAIAAHELKTPMTSLRGFAELGVRAIDAHGTLDPVLARRTLETIDRQSGRLSALVANLLEVARGTSDRQAIASRPINLAELVQSVVDAARVRADQYVISLDTPDDVPVVADPLRIEQVLTNLLDNAVKYSPPGASIDVRVQPTIDRVEVEVRDHGMGIPPEHQHRIFDRFFRAHVTDQVSGMGLGLYISQEIMRRHGGLIRAISPDDGGTLMIVTLPRTSEVPGTPESVVPNGQRTA